MTEPVLALTGISRSFGALRANDDISLTLRAGEIHALIGPNGAGKSTLIQQIAGALKPDRGRITFLGRDITGLSTASRARLGLARTFQISALAMEHTVLQNAVLGALGHSGRVFRFFHPVMDDPALVEPARAALARTGLADLAHQRTGALSHGQRRQLEVAIALTLEPRAFLMDEPMAGMGADGSRMLTEFLRTLSRDAPILLVEHDMDAVFALADRISVLDYGRVIATGSVDEIRAHPEVRRAYLGGEGVG